MNLFRVAAASSVLLHLMSSSVSSEEKFHWDVVSKIREESYQVLLTLESRDGDYVQRALDSLLARLPEDAVFKVE